MCTGFPHPGEPKHSAKIWHDGHNRACLSSRWRQRRHAYLNSISTLLEEYPDELLKNLKRFPHTFFTQNMSFHLRWTSTGIQITESGGEEEPASSSIELWRVPHQVQRDSRWLRRPPMM